MKRRARYQSNTEGLPVKERVLSPWWDRHPAAYVHAGIHGIFLALVFGAAAFPLAVVHLIIDCRWPLVWWSKHIQQTQPENRIVANPSFHGEAPAMLYDMGIEVRIWTDQVFHLFSIAVAALLVTQL